MAFLPMVAMGLSAAGTVVSAIGQNNAGKAEQQAANYNARVAEMNAAAEQDRAGVEADDYRRQQSRKLASSIAARGASGVAIGSGTPLMVSEDVVREIELGASRIGHEGATKANAYRNQATLDRVSGKNARKAGRIAAGATLLSGGARAFGGSPSPNSAWGY
jgi:hypothetical protein